MLADKEPGWHETATALPTMGLRDGEDKPPAGERTRKAWWSVRRAKTEAAAKHQVARVALPLAPGEITPAIHAVPAHRWCRPPSRPCPGVDCRRLDSFRSSPRLTCNRMLPCPEGKERRCGHRRRCQDGEGAARPEDVAREGYFHRHPCSWSAVATAGAMTPVISSSGMAAGEAATSR